MSPLSRGPSPHPNPVPPSIDNEPENASQAPDFNSKQSPIIDMITFHQILDLDEDDTHDFSRGMAWAYFSQVTSTFKEMDDAFAVKDLPRLSSLGHFLKGSSAALGVMKVQASCELIQNYGKLLDTETNRSMTNEVALGKIGPLLTRVKEEYQVAETWLKGWYAQHDSGDSGSKD